MINDVVPTADSISLLDPDNRPGTVKFDLFVKAHEMRELSQSLEHILLLPKDQRQDWLHDHEELVNDLLETFVQDSTLALDGLQLDQEAMQLSIDFVTSLRDVMNTLRGILDDAQSLVS